MKASVYNVKNEVVGEVDLSEGIFNRSWNPDLVHQVLLAKAANRRKPTAHTKNRAEVRGGGAKPWRQKGTGRARHGSRRSPLWKGGGATFGPTKEKNYEQKINKKMLRAALHSALSKKLADGELKIVNSLSLADHKTKNLYAVLKVMQAFNSLLVPAKENKPIYRACSNLPKAKCLAANSLNVEDVLKYKTVLLDKEALGEIK